MGIVRASWILFAFHLRRTLFSQRALLACGLACLPVGAATLIYMARHEVGSPPAVEVGWMLVVQIVVPLIALMLGSAVVAEEIEDRTITYLFTRPVPRAALLVGRWVAAWLVIVFLVTTTTAATSGILDNAAMGKAEHTLPPGYVERLLFTVAIGGTAYSMIFAAAGALLKRPVIVGLGYTFAVETFLANLPGTSQALTIQFYLKSYLFAENPALLERLQGGFLSAELAAPDAALRMLGWIWFAGLAIGVWTLSRKQYVLPA